MAEPSKAVTAADQARRLVELARMVDKGKPKPADLAEFRELLNLAPDVWRVFGDMGRQAEHKLIESLNTTKSSHESMRAGLDTLRRDLGYPKAPMLERILIDQVAVSWLRLQVLELKHAHHTGQSIGIPQADYWDRTLSAAQRRHLRAAETLARVRRMLRPRANVQVNMAGRQVVMNT